jgi:hypothetical protein
MEKNCTARSFPLPKRGRSSWIPPDFFLCIIISGLPSAVKDLPEFLQAEFWKVGVWRFPDEGNLTGRIFPGGIFRETI